MCELVIVGNGFDRYHGLPTSYYDYKAFLGRTGRDPGLLDELCGRYTYSPWDAQDQPPWSNVEAALNLVWDDIVSESIDGNPVILTDDNPDWVGAEVDLDSKTGFLEQLTGPWLRDWADSISLSGVRPLLAMPLDAFYVTFNYTDTLEAVYGLDPDRILHIHGSRLNPSEPLQFGYPGPEPAIIGEGLKRDYVDESDIYSVSTLPCVESAVEHYREAWKDIRSNYERLGSFLARGFDRVLVMGHTFDGLDRPYYDDVIMPRAPYSDWEFFENPNDGPDKRAHFVELVECFAPSSGSWRIRQYCELAL